MGGVQSLPRLLSMRALSPLFGNRRPSSLNMMDIMQCASCSIAGFAATLLVLSAL